MRRHELVGGLRIWQMKRQFQIDFLRINGLQPHHTLLDIGCGTLRGGIPLINYLESGRYTGIEVRAEVLNEGRKELKEAGLEHKNANLIHFSQFADLQLNLKFDYIWAFSVLFHMEDEIMGEALHFVAGHLATDGVFYANVNIGEGKLGHWQGFPIQQHSLEFYQKAAESAGLKVADIGSLTECGHHSGISTQDEQRMLKFKLR